LEDVDEIGVKQHFEREVDVNKIKVFKTQPIEKISEGQQCSRGHVRCSPEDQTSREG